MATVQFTVEQFEALLARLGHPQAPAHAIVRTAVVAGSVGWAELPLLDTRKPSGIDAWFMMFEAKLKAGKVDVDRWAEKFTGTRCSVY